MRGPALLAIVAVALSLAACVAEAPAARESKNEEASATVWGLVLDVERRPLAGAQVTRVDDEASVLSDEAGRYEFHLTAAGPSSFHVGHPSYEPTSFQVEPVQGETIRHDVVLQPRPLPVPFTDPFFFHGTYDCAHEVVFLVGDCLVVFENVTGQPDPITKETYAFGLPVKANWTRIELNLTWQSGAENQLEGMRLLLETGNSSKTGHGTSVAQIEGENQPLRIVVVRGEAHKEADRYEGTKTPARVPDDGELLQVRVFPRGRLSDELQPHCPAGICLFGVGVGLDIGFDVHALVHYGPVQN